MAVVKIGEKVTEENLKKAREEYGDFIKIVADIVTGAMAIGGEWHADAEKTLLDSGSRQDDIWGGSIDLASNQIDTIALINIRPRLDNNSQEILDPKIREKFVVIVKKKFSL